MKILIINSVPLNGGDEALLRATTESIYQRYPKAEINVLCSKDLEICRSHLPDIRLNVGLDGIPNIQGNKLKRVKPYIAKKIRQKIGKSNLSKIADLAFERKEKREIIEFYRESDIIISSPGGFIHDFYRISDRLDSLELAIDLGKPVMIFAQSVGPFWKPNSIKRVPEVLNRVSAICVRDSISVKYLTDIGVDKDKICVTADAAFLWHRLAPDLFCSNPSQAKKLGLCLRVWPLNDTENIVKTVEKAAKLCENILQDSEKEIHFISTCQGLDGYVDDSEVALKVVDTLSSELQKRCQVDRKRYTPRELITRLSQLDAFISMRLHGCILAMLGGTPAMGLGYEDKTAQIFKQLDLEQYQIRFEENLETWLICKDRFMQDIEKIQTILPSKLNERCLAADMNLDFISKLTN